MLQGKENIVLIFYFAGTILIFLLVTAIAIYILVHQKKVNQFKFQLELEELKKQELQFLAIQEGEEKERVRLAQELHDGIGAALSGLKMNIDWVLENLNHAEVKNKLQITYEGLNNAVIELREISHNLQPAFFGDKLLSTAIYEYAEQLNLKTNCNFEVYADENVEKINANLKLNCYRIVSELMLNVVKHAKATHASVQIMNNDDTLQLIIEDNGIGFSVSENNSGIGLLNIKNRVEVCKGKINIDSSSSGTSIIIDLPFK